MELLFVYKIKSEGDCFWQTPLPGLEARYIDKGEKKPNIRQTKDEWLKRCIWSRQYTFNLQIKLLPQRSQDEFGEKRNDEAIVLKFRPNCFLKWNECRVFTFDNILVRTVYFILKKKDVSKILQNNINKEKLFNEFICY